jgi:hypothetical protein
MHGRTYWYDKKDGEKGYEKPINTTKIKHSNMKNVRFITPIQQLLTWGWDPHTKSHPYVRDCCAVVVMV